MSANYIPATSAGLDPVDLSKILLPYRAISFMLCTALYAVLGFIL